MTIGRVLLLSFVLASVSRKNIRVEFMNNEVLCIGELLIDFICSDVDVRLAEGEHFVKKAGGAPANVAVTLSQLGAKSYFAGKVGADAFGVFLEETLRERGVDTRMLVQDPRYSTTLAFVSLDQQGERDFMFNRGADAYHSLEELDHAVIRRCGIFHFGSAVALLGGPTKATYLQLLEQAKTTGKFVSFDPNYRADLWKDSALDFDLEVLPLLEGVQFLKVSEEELQRLTGDFVLESAVEKLHGFGAGIIAVTRGSEGAYVSSGEQRAFVDSVKIKSVDSTGAGDAFVGGFLYGVAQRFEAWSEDCTEKYPEELLKSFESVVELTKFANVVGALVCTKLGAMEAIPRLEEVLANMK